LVVSLSAEHGFVHWASCGRILEGWAALCGGKVEQGIELLREGVAAWRQGGARLWLPIFLALEAEAYAASGRNEAALRVTEEALAESESSGERWMSAELLRIKARLLLATERASDEVEALLVHSLETARRQQARCYELRAACDLARLRQGQNRGKQALQLVQSIYDQFTEGLETRDLQNARTLIESLSAARSPG
jgi:predicted ATPase